MSKRPIGSVPRPLPLALKQRIAVLLLGIAAVCWVMVVFRQRSSGTAQDHIQAGISAAQQANARTAEKEWWEAIRLDPKNTDAPQLLGELYLSLHEWEKGALVFQNLLRLNPRAARAHGNLATCLYYYGDQMGAYREAQEELKSDPDFTSSLIIVARMSSALSQEQEMDSALHRLVTQQPENPALLKLYGEHLVYSNRFREAEPILERLIRLAPNDSSAISLRGINEFNSDMSAEGATKAEADFRRAIQLSPTTPLSHLYLGKLYRRIGKKAEAIAELETAYRLVPDLIAVCFELSQMYEQVGDKAKAATLRTKLVALRQEDDLKNTLQKRCVSDRDNFENHLRLGQILLKNGQLHDATYYLNRAALLRPSDPQSRAELAKLARVTRQTPPEQDIASRLLLEQLAVSENR